MKCVELLFWVSERKETPCACVRVRVCVILCVKGERKSVYMSEREREHILLNIIWCASIFTQIYQNTHTLSLSSFTHHLSDVKSHSADPCHRQSSS